MDVPHLVAADLRHDGHRRMVGVDLVGHLGQFLDGSPKLGRVVAAFHLVAQAPEQQGRVLLVLQHRAADVLGLARDRPGIVVAEPLVLVAQPAADGDGQPAPLGFVQVAERVGADRPGAKRVSAAAGQHRLGSAAAPATDEVGLAGAQQLPLLPTMDDLDRRRSLGLRCPGGHCPRQPHRQQRTSHLHGTDVVR